MTTTTCDLSPNQSLERTRWAPAVRSADRQLCRAAQLQIRDFDDDGTRLGWFDADEQHGRHKRKKFLEE